MTIDPAPLPGALAPSAPLPPVTTVSVSPAVSAPSTYTVTLSPASVAFIGNEAVYVSPQTAEAVLKGVAEEITTNNYDHVVLTGTTALPDPRDTLSTARAMQVKATLVADGVPAQDIGVIGVGEDFPGFISDVNPDGSLNNAAAQQNRLVIITATQ